MWKSVSLKSLQKFCGCYASSRVHSNEPLLGGRMLSRELFLREWLL